MELTNIGTIKTLFEKHGFSFSKSLGQNFLVNPAVCPRIAELGGCRRGTAAIEIGTGIGVLTKELAERCDKVLAIEIDEGLKPILAETLAGYNNVEIVFTDVIKADLSALIAERLGGFAEVNVCANLPYYITSPVLMKLLEERLSIRSITVMVQREAAERICAKPGERECGAVTAAIRYYAKPEILFRVSRGSFLPAPKVDSAVIRLTLPQTPEFPVADERLFFRIVRGAFSQRRKQIVNPLSAALGIEKSALIPLLEKAGVSPAARPETLTMENFVDLCNTIAEK
ncbi:MAG: 16S rRNA (adenine(1518)-N(6)/adenine(1519)-N(6))-dimethyltransferase RsmA [Bacteroides sp.]|nr:16S rRNA (adenine(1518)-N(6)/adenine(1519)-N(6))-dimethyltransferase RsmA [Eubacterium sp.]MCM1417893.1 16S rRNA (adenine(1518)-N(6)/adenine(1519)-N(6))-dimethyltransferase RsmA [Roseburia sp.]MCM1461943.1 16S rRNA (adenine(1518)-N(6)/adenine(1519)-N(6))-dimethyltransferase RsmA [Bacteroides sp.]